MNNGSRYTITIGSKILLLKTHPKRADPIMDYVDYMDYFGGYQELTRQQAADYLRMWRKSKHAHTMTREREY